MNTYKLIEQGFKEYENWRYLKNVRAVFTTITENRAVRHERTKRKMYALLGNYYAVTFPELTILEFLSTSFPKVKVMVGKDFPHPTFCKGCYGAGKFDWISNITGPSYVSSKFEFIRDKRVVLLYRKPNGDLETNHIWAPTEVGLDERICDSCLGTGINLKYNDYLSDYSIKDLRYNLIACDIRYFITP